MINPGLTPWATLSRPFGAFEAASEHFCVSLLPALVHSHPASAKSDHLVVAVLTFPISRGWSLWFVAALSDDSQICGHHQGLSIFNPDVSGAAQVFVNR